MTRAEVRGVAALVTGFALAYALFGLFRHWHFGSSAYDLGIFDQAVWHLSRLETPASTISGFSNILGDHFYPVIALFAPLYWIAPAPETLIVAQAILLALSIVPVFLFLRDREPAVPALLLSAACALFWGLQSAMAFDVHEMAFAPLAIAVVILAADRRRWIWCWAAAALIVLVKEDLIPLLTMLGLLLAASGARRHGALLAAASLIAFVVIVRIVIPSFAASGAFSVGSAYADVVARPWTIPVTLLTPSIKMRTALWWFAPFAFLPLGSPLALLLVPLVLERFLSSSPNHWGTAFHYSAPLAPILAMSAGDGLARLGRRIGTDATRARVLIGAAAACVLLSSLLPGHQPLWRLLSPKTYEAPATARTGDEALARIPAGASVVAQAAIVPHLSRRNLIYMLDAKAPDADFVVAAADLSPWPVARFADLAPLLEDRRRHGYTVVFDQDGWIVLRRAPN
ncbi:MAG: DUF2079 domain-containing protein [Acidobacteriia bacterium]|nr:DUF2079 domain-containing protein [Terriglobia bacterium]